MNKKETNIWYKKYKALGNNEKYEYMMDLFEKGITEDFLKHIDMLSFLCDIFEDLKKEGQYEKMLDLYNKVYDSSELIDKAFYLDDYPINYFLYNQKPEELKRCFKNYLLDPVESIDTFIPLFDKLIYYGHRDLSLEIALEVHDKIKNASGLLGSAEDDFGSVIYMECMQNIYHDLKNDRTIKKDDIVSYLKKYDYDLGDMMNQIIEILQPGDIRTLDHNDYLEDKSDFINDLALLFARYMFEEKGFNFSTSTDIWYVTCKYFHLDKEEKIHDDEYHSRGVFSPWSFEEDEEDDEDMIIPDEDDIATDKKTENNGEEKIFDTAFMLVEDTFDNDLSGRMYFISNKKASGFAVSWGIVYIYDFLYKYEYISEKIYLDALRIIAESKAELISGYKSVLWEYGFVHTWQKPDSIDIEEYKSEKKLFYSSFKK